MPLSMNLSEAILGLTNQNQSIGNQELTDAINAVENGNQQEQEAGLDALDLLYSILEWPDKESAYNAIYAIWLTVSPNSPPRPTTR